MGSHWRWLKYEFGHLAAAVVVEVDLISYGPLQHDESGFQPLEPVVSGFSCDPGSAGCP